MKRIFIILAVAGSSLLGMAVFAADTLNPEGDLPLRKDYQERQERVSRWYAPARFGVFYNWGLFTGSSDSGENEIRYQTIADFEAAAKDPDVIASNLVATAKLMGARYITFSLLHSNDRHAVMFPARTPGFKLVTTKDYIGALAARCQQEHIPLLLYFCGSNDHAFFKDGNWLDDSLRDKKKYVAATKGLLDELAARCPGQIAGFWIDGEPSDLPAYIRKHFPDSIIVHNNDDYFGWGVTDYPDIDDGTTEFLSGPADPDYSRPSGLVKTHVEWGLLPPSRDYNEDIPVVGSWWYKTTGPNGEEDGYKNSRYAKDPTFVVKQMVSSLGQRRQWNFAIGVGPMIDGTVSPYLQPMVEALHNYLAWASESIYDTIGGEGSALKPGWWSGGAYGSITVSLKDPKVLYVHVTTAPKADNLRIPKYGYKVASVVDLRTGESVKFTDIGVLILQNQDWSDVQTYGDKVFKVTLTGTP